MAPFQFVPRSSARTNYFFPSIESLPLPTLCYPLSLRSLFSRGGPISLIVGPLKGDEKEDDGERGEAERERDKKGDIDLISGRDRQWCRCRSLLRSLSPHRPIYLSIASRLSRIRRAMPHCKSQRGAHLTLFRLPSSSPFFLVRAFRGHFDSSHEISVMRREGRERSH